MGQNGTGWGFFTRRIYTKGTVGTVYRVSIKIVFISHLPGFHVELGVRERKFLFMFWLCIHGVERFYPIAERAFWAWGEHYHVSMYSDCIYNTPYILSISTPVYIWVVCTVNLWCIYI